MESLSSEQLAGLREGLLGEHSEELIDLLFRLNLREQPAPEHRELLQQINDLGLLADDGVNPTALGDLVGDSIREYCFWRDRNGRLHFESKGGPFSAEFLAGRSVLEIGSGFGCNLFSLLQQGVEGRFVGLEPVEAYLQMTPIIAERENLPIPEIVAGNAEAMPFEDNEFDAVVCYSAHQYMDIRKALKEVQRVLRPGGHLQIIGGTMDSWLIRDGRFLLTNMSLRAAARYVITFCNTLAYQVFGRRIVIPGGPAATTAPIYPDRRTMTRWLVECGFIPAVGNGHRYGLETCFLADNERSVVCEPSRITNPRRRQVSI